MAPTAIAYRNYEITSRAPGKSTGDELVVTADGRAWRSVSAVKPSTGMEHGEDAGDRIRPIQD